MTYKGSRHRTNGDDYKKYQNAAIWDNFKKNKEAQKEAKKQGINICKVICHYCKKEIQPKNGVYQNCCEENLKLWS